MFDKNPRTNAADVFIAGKTAAQVVAALVEGTAPEGTLLALHQRFERKVEARAQKAA